MTEFPTKLFFVFNAMAAKLCKEKQTSFGNNMKYSDFIDGKYFGGGGNWRIKGTHCSKEIASSKENC